MNAAPTRRAGTRFPKTRMAAGIAVGNATGAMPPDQMLNSFLDVFLPLLNASGALES